MDIEPSKALRTDLERQIVVLVAQGYPNHAIARELQVSLLTVNRLLRLIARRTGVSDRLDLILYAIVHGVSGSGSGVVTSRPVPVVPPQELPAA
jgi:DNA-binding NarL/FixJ family response regulator